MPTFKKLNGASNYIFYLHGVLHIMLAGRTLPFVHYLSKLTCNTCFLYDAFIDLPMNQSNILAEYSVPKFVNYIVCNFDHIAWMSNKMECRKSNWAIN